MQSAAVKQNEILPYCTYLCAQAREMVVEKYVKNLVLHVVILKQSNYRKRKLKTEDSPA